MCEEKKYNINIEKEHIEEEKSLTQELEETIDEFFDPDKDQVASLNDKLNEFINKNPYEEIEISTKNCEKENNEEIYTEEKFKNLKIEKELKNLKKSINSPNKTIPIITDTESIHTKESQPDLNEALSILKEKSLGKSEKKGQNINNKEKEKEISNSDIDKSLSDFLKKLNT